MSTALASRELKTFHQIPNSFRIPLAMSVAGNGIASSGRIDTNVRPKYSCRNLHGRHCRYRNALLCAAKQPGLDAQHVFRADHNTSGKEKIPARQSAGRKALRVGCRISHVSTLSDFRARSSTKGSLAKCQVPVSTPIPERLFSRSICSPRSEWPGRSASQSSQTCLAP